MRNLKKIFFGLIFIFLLSSCSTLNNTNFYNNLSKNSNYLKPSASYITSYVLSKQKSEEKREKMARIIYDLSLALETLTGEEDITPEVFSEVISKYIPDESNWNDFTVNIILLYAEFYSQVKELPEENKAKILIKALNRIYSGCRVSSSEYLKT